MKKPAILLLLTATAIAAAAQYQLPNGGFEQWDAASLTAEPTHWNSFATSDGSYASLASSPHHYHRTGGRPGGTGSSYLTIYTRSIFGIKANGNMTTGRIHAGSMTASSSDNYNYTQRSNSSHCQPFSGTPDSMYVWVSFYAHSASSQAQVSAILHGDNDFRAPNQETTPSLYCGKAQARFNRTTTSASAMQWQQMKVPFVYDGTSPANYLLVNITTNATPGSGDADDSLSIDDIEFIYSAWLAGITVGGTPVEGFDKGKMDYSVHVENLESEVTGIPEADDATVAVGRQTIDDTTALVLLTVTAEDGITLHHYTVTLTTGRPRAGIAHPATPRLALHPNPASDKVTLRLPMSTTRLALLDLSGREVITQTGSLDPTVTLDIAPLPAGIYLLRTLSPSGTDVQRLVKK